MRTSTKCLIKKGLALTLAVTITAAAFTNTESYKKNEPKAAAAENSSGVSKDTDSKISSAEKSLEELEKKLEEMFLGGEISYNDEVMITRARQKDALQQAKESFLLVKDGAAMSVPEDLLTIDLMNAYEELGKVIGESVEEDLVNEIFGKFCMGK